MFAATDSRRSALCRFTPLAAPSGNDRDLREAMTGVDVNRPFALEKMDSLLGGRRTSAFPVDAPSILRVRSVHLSRDARLAQPLGKLVDVRLIPKWEPADVLGK
jgi:hypothetical protein